MRVLAIDTCGPVIGVALTVGGEIRCRTKRVTRGAEAHLMPWAVELAEEAGLALSELDGVAAAVGPGAFTGLRVGLAAACGVALAAERPLWAGCSLTSRALRVGAEGPVLALLDARKARVYAAWVGPGGESFQGPADVAPQVAVDWAAGAPVQATGEGAVVYRELIEAAGGRVVDDAEDPAVDVLARLGAEGLSRGEGIDPATVEPRYLRAPDAKPPKGLSTR